MMDDFKNILVMGAGGVGGYFGGRIAQHTSSKVTLIARGPHLTALQKNGLKINSSQGNTIIDVEAFENPTEAPQPDLILFTVKSFDTPAAIDKTKPIVADNTQILTIQNGIENYPQLVKAFGSENVIQGFCKIGAGIASPGVVEHKAFGKITVGEQDGTVSSRLEKLKVLCEQAQIPLHISSEIKRKVWLKFAWNGVFNMITAVANVTVDKLYEHDEAVALCYAIFDEIRMVAGKEGVSITQKDGQDIIEAAQKLEGFTTSTYQDRQKGKKLEYEAFTGAIIRLGNKHQVAIPHHQALYALLKLIDNAEA